MHDMRVSKSETGRVNVAFEVAAAEFEGWGEERPKKEDSDRLESVGGGGAE